MAVESEAKLPPHADGDSRPPERRVLVADDDPTARMMAAATLEADGYNVVQAVDGVEALVAIRECRPHLVVVDISMPRLDGFQVCAEIRSDPALVDTPVLVVTSLDDIESVERAYKAGATDFISKPVNWMVFSQRVRYMLRARQAFLQMKEAKKAAEAAVQARVNFLANVSHEIRTPLTAILGFLEVAAATDDVDGKKEDDALEVIRRNSEHLLELVDRLLSAAEVDCDQVSIRAELCVPAQIVNGVIEKLRPAARAKGLELAAKTTGCEELRLVSDATRIGQILTNLVSNAIKFTETGGVEVQLRSAHSGTRQDIELIVSDSGIGMDDDHLRQVFEPFFQVDDTPTRAQGGVGLGLALVKQTIDMLGGSITSRSRVGAGTQFCVRLPNLA